MLADAAAQSWGALAWMRAVPRLPQPIVAVSRGVAGFEAVFVDLLAAAWRCPGSSTVDGYAPRPTATATMPIGKLAAARRSRSGKDHDDCQEQQDKQVGFTVGNLLPIVAVGGTELRRQTVPASWKRSSTTPVTPRSNKPSPTIANGPAFRYRPRWARASCGCWSTASSP
jgi:hypothetical protein